MRRPAPDPSFSLGPSTRRLGAALLVSLLLGVAVSPLHFALANHSHRLNLATGRFEDVLAHPGAHRDAGPSLDAPGAPRTDYQDCFVSNCSQLQYGLLSAPATLVAHAVDSSLGPTGASRASAALLFQLAPKQSPPC